MSSGGNKVEDELLFARSYSTPLSYHTKTPQFYDEIKILLPMTLHERHHLLFKFFHVSCTSAATNDDDRIETCVGYAWLPLFRRGRLLVGATSALTMQLPVAQSLCNNYLSMQNVDTIKWVENMKPLFRVDCRAHTTLHTHVILSYFYVPYICEIDF